MIEHFRQTVKVVFKNPILVTFYVGIILVLQIFAGVILGQSYTNIFAYGLAISCLALFVIALFAGWFAMCKNYLILEKKQPLNNEKDKITPSSVFFSGIGEYFWKNTLVFLISSVIFVLLLWGGYCLLKSIYPSINEVFLVEIKKIYTALNENKPPSLNITNDNLIFFMVLGFLQIFFLIFEYIIMFFVGGIYFSQEKNILLSTLKLIFSNLLDVINMLLIILVGYFLMQVCLQILSLTFITSLFGIFLVGFFMSIYTMAVFKFYDEKTKSLCNSRSDS